MTIPKWNCRGGVQGGSIALRESCRIVEAEWNSINQLRPCGAFRTTVLIVDLLRRTVKRFYDRSPGHNCRGSFMQLCQIMIGRRWWVHDLVYLISGIAYYGCIILTRL